MDEPIIEEVVEEAEPTEEEVKVAEEEVEKLPEVEVGETTPEMEAGGGVVAEEGEVV